MNRIPFQSRKSTSAREAALQVLFHVGTRKAFADLQLNRQLKKGGLETRDAALATELVNGTLRWRGRIDWLLGEYVRAGIETLSPWVVNVLRLGVYQIQFLDRVPDHAAVDEAVKLARRYSNPGAAGLVNAVLRSVIRDKENPKDPLRIIQDPIRALSVAYSHPRWMVERWLRRAGEEETVSWLKANNRTPGFGLRVNTARTDRQSLLAILQEQGVEGTASSRTSVGIRVEGNMVPSTLEAFADGLFFVQDESETMVGELVDAPAGALVLDLCAAPGGKATHIQERRNGKGRLIAVDIQESRLERVRENLKRLGTQGVDVVCEDGTHLRLEEPADVVLVDAPCTGMGVLARRSDARWRKTETMIRKLAKLQMELITAGAENLKPGGVLVYSVCSNEPEESETLVNTFLQGHPDFELQDASAYVPAEIVRDGFMEMLPHKTGTDGSFAARLVRKLS